MMVFVKQLSENKILEIQLAWLNGWTRLFWVSLHHFTKGHHPGWFFEFHFLQLIFFELNIYDTRHEDEINESKHL